MASTPTVRDVIAEHVAAVSAFDVDAIMATFADDAFVNDAHREFWGSDTIRRWVEKEMVGDHVTLEGSPRSSSTPARPSWSELGTTATTTRRTCRRS